MSMDIPHCSFDLITRIQDGDSQAETELVECYSRTVMSIIRRSLGDPTHADDLFQEVFYIVLEKIRKGDVREAARLPGFVCGVARNQVIKHFQRTSKQERLIEYDETVSISHTSADRLNELQRKEKADIVRQVLKEMANERDIHVLFRFYFAEDDKEQICIDLGLTSLQFNLVIHRARERYRQLYEQRVNGKQ